MRSCWKPRTALRSLMGSMRDALLSTMLPMALSCTARTQLQLFAVHTQELVLYMYAHGST